MNATLHELPFSPELGGHQRPQKLKYPLCLKNII
jgi:hypothetical protein